MSYKKIISILMLLSISGSAFSEKQILQLNEKCIVSILNRTVNADENGLFAMPNVHPFMGQVRASSSFDHGAGVFTCQTDTLSMVNSRMV